MDRSGFVDTQAYKVCVIWILENAILKRLKIGRGKNVGEQQFAKRGFKSCAVQDLNSGRAGQGSDEVTVCCCCVFNSNRDAYKLKCVHRLTEE
jgi:hypothetical protein